MIDSPTLGTATTSDLASSHKPREPLKSTINFSRPHARSRQQEQQDAHHPHLTPHVRAVNAYFDPKSDQQNPFPDEPCFNNDDTAVAGTPSPTASTPAPDQAHDVTSELAWDPQREEMISKLRSTRPPFRRIDDQRHIGTTSRESNKSSISSSSNSSNNSSGDSGSSHSTHTTSGTGSSSSRTTAGPGQSPSLSRTPTTEAHKSPLPLKSILKKTEVEITSESVTSEGSAESVRSHHTISESGSFNSAGKWSSSDYDTSCLSEKEIRKLEKKGINPALYVEMKATRSGKKGFGALVGNSFVG